MARALQDREQEAQVRRLHRDREGNNCSITLHKTLSPKWKGMTRRLETRNRMSAIHRQDSSRLNKLFMDLNQNKDEQVSSKL